MSFDKELIVAIAETERLVDMQYRSAVIDVFNRIVLETPFRDGGAKASWLVGPSNNGAIGTKQQQFTLFDIEPLGQQTVLFSNLPYMKRLSEGWSAQQPTSTWIQQIVQTWPQTVKKYER
jgi:hypothetical protein